MFVFIFYCKDKKDQSVNYTEKIYLFFFGLSLWGHKVIYNKKHNILCMDFSPCYQDHKRPELGRYMYCFKT